MLRGQVSNGTAQQNQAKEYVERQPVVSGQTQVLAGQLLSTAALCIFPGAQQLFFTDL